MLIIYSHLEEADVALPNFGKVYFNLVKSGQVAAGFAERVIRWISCGVPGLKCASGEERHWTRRAYGTR
jgi:hypothetical protein